MLISEIDHAKLSSLVIVAILRFIIYFWRKMKVLAFDH